MSDHRIFELWQEFALHQKQVELSMVTPEIAASWHRSRDLGLDPFLAELQSVTDQELNQRRRKVQELITSSLPYMHKLFTLIKDEQAVITLCDTDAVILEVLANPTAYPEIVIRRRNHS